MGVRNKPFVAYIRTKLRVTVDRNGRKKGYSLLESIYFPLASSAHFSPTLFARLFIVFSSFQNFKNAPVDIFDRVKKDENQFTYFHRILKGDLINKELISQYLKVGKQDFFIELEFHETFIDEMKKYLSQKEIDKILQSQKRRTFS